MHAGKAWQSPADTFETNVLGTVHLYEALRRHPPHAGVFLASSAAAYGAVDALPMREEALLRPVNPYGVSKACQDMLSLQYALNFNLRIVRGRLFITTGPGKTGDVLNDFAQRVAQLERRGQPGKLRVGNLEVRRDISDVRDVVRAIWIVFERGDPRQPINVGAGQSFSVRAIAEALGSSFPGPAHPRTRPDAPPTDRRARYPLGHLPPSEPGVLADHPSRADDRGLARALAQVRDRLTENVRETPVRDERTGSDRF